MNLFLATLMADRAVLDKEDRVEIGYSTTPILFEPDTGTDTVEGAAREACLMAFPMSERWENHREHFVELPSGTRFYTKDGSNPFIFNWTAFREEVKE